jgi:hypothetical protein
MRYVYIYIYIYICLSRQKDPPCGSSADISIIEHIENTHNIFETHLNITQTKHNLVKTAWHSSRILQTCGPGRVQGESGGHRWNSLEQILAACYRTNWFSRQLGNLMDLVLRSFWNQCSDMFCWIAWPQYFRILVPFWSCF